MVTKTNPATRSKKGFPTQADAHMLCVHACICFYKQKGSTYRPASSLFGAVVCGKLTRMCETLTARKGKNIWNPACVNSWVKQWNVKSPMMPTAEAVYWYALKNSSFKHRHWGNTGNIFWSDLSRRTHFLSRDYCDAKYLNMDFQIPQGSTLQPPCSLSMHTLPLGNAIHYQVLQLYFYLHDMHILMSVQLNDPVPVEACHSDRTIWPSITIIEFNRDKNINIYNPDSKKVGKKN